MVKVERSFPTPDSLAEEKKKANGSYSEPDVIERLAKDFHNKCYICELDKLQDPQVEHLRPHFGGKNIERKFDWNNLFWSCSHCNGVKNQRKYDESIIDCCKLDPEERIYFKVKDEAGMTSEGDRLFVECNVSPEGKEVCGIHTEELYEDYSDGFNFKNDIIQKVDLEMSDICI